MDVSGNLVGSNFKGIYRTEAECKVHGFSSEPRHAHRQAHAMPLVDALFQWVRETQPSLVPKTPPARVEPRACRVPDRRHRGAATENPGPT
ncbi:uncharacterized protein CMC5_028520 [Chondromyces crocatus]|uniref:Transposase n=1 Tax=Chondromyces crocatus TaxID=52 RepID=A0A0K1ECY5_CHOCO|nr:uncharacterized protein CMC5_028520 [Chondromyces crocatus]